MPDLSSLEYNGITYNLKDAQARANLDTLSDAAFQFRKRLTGGQNGANVDDIDDINLLPGQYRITADPPNSDDWAPIGWPLNHGGNLFHFRKTGGSPQAYTTLQIIWAPTASGIFELLFRSYDSVHQVWSVWRDLSKNDVINKLQNLPSIFPDAYDNNKQYYYGEIVNYKGKVYSALNKQAGNYTPTNTNYWQEINVKDYIPITRHCIRNDIKICELVTQGSYFVIKDGDDWKPQGWPTERGGVLFVFGNTGSRTRNKCQIIFSDAKIIYRIGNADNPNTPTDNDWTPWRIFATQETLENTINSTENAIKEQFAKQGYITSLAERIDKIEAKVFENDSNHPYLPAAFINDNYLQNKIDEINAIRNDSNFKGVQIAFITDTHMRGYSNGNTKYSHTLLNKICQQCQINIVVNGGDIIGSAGTDIINCIDQVREGIRYSRPDWPVPHFFIGGNHDLGTEKTVSAVLNAKQLQRLTNLEETGVSKIVRDSTLPFQYYWDDDVNKFRFIFLCYGMTGWNSESNSSWWGVDAKSIPNCAPFFLNALKTTPKNYYIVVFNHMPGIPIGENSTWPRNFSQITNADYQTYLYKALVAYRDKTTLISNNQTIEDFTTITDSGIVTCGIFGHHHVDIEGTTKDIDDIDTNSNKIGIPLFATTCDNFGGRLVSYQNTKQYVKNVAGANYTPIDKPAFDIYSINTNTNKIKITRIGYGDNRYGLNNSGYDFPSN